MADNGGNSSAALKGGGLAGALTVILVWLMELVWEIKIPGEVAVAITTVLLAIGAYTGIWIEEWRTRSRNTSRPAAVDS